ncbi:PSD1 and planctomycete cytochrome C domain-containing protein [Flavihumibacter profundi]|uniref:PSD1 and planctomycete cytochrome C domain-containing protein n=1 Tax=Flavihumibacter profundi TaxID=2716883 RepID=UPI001CC6F4EC|nr:PSD1 and planctomycete cytochrome C domain-containing protein [Flavihumibacter profundi]MBZ5856094.1 PSD1 and planctomycete cytochrome C domain-containing protein [Flavihumibacter profundi]
MGSINIFYKGKANFHLKAACITFLIVLICFPSFIANAQESPVEIPAKEGFWLWSLLGRFHPAIVHFPIGFLYIAILLEWIGRRKKTGQFESSIYITVLVAAISSVLAVVLGLVLSNTESYGSNVLVVHQWTGIATMIFSCITAYLYQKKLFRYAFLFLFASTIGVTVAGHYGAELTHGDDYLTSVLPKGEEEVVAGEDGEENKFSLASLKGPITNEQVQELNFQVRTILAHNCYSCHGPGKMKGELRLDSKESIFKGGKNGIILKPGHPETSEIIRRVTLPRTHKEAMPSKGKALTSNEIAILEYWIKQGAPWPSGPEKSLYRVAALEPRLPEVPAASENLTNPIDRFVGAYFQKHKIQWSSPVDDRIYIRRVYLDVIGLVPPPDSIDAYVQDKRPDKQSILVRNLLNRNNDYAQHWLTFWNDALRNDYTGTGYITGGRFDITQWLYNSLLENKPYNTFVKELLSPDSSSAGFIRGIQWRGVINSSQSTEMQAAQNVSQVFLGLNLKCTSCHDSFISDWKLDDAYAFANLFSDSSLEIHRCDKPTGKMAGRRILFKDLGVIDSTATRINRLKQLADNLVQPRDGRLYRTFVNRMWAQFFGRGIIEPVDMMDNKPWNQDLIDWLAYDFVASGYDTKKLIQNILTSQTYQLPSVAMKDPELVTAPGYVFQGMVRKRLTAEQFADAVSETLQPIYQDSMIVFNLLPEKVKYNIPFARASLMRNDPFLTALGRPNRETVSTSRSSQANLLQALELTNGNLFNEAMKKAAEKWKNKYPDPVVMIRQVYRNALGRLPMKHEEEIALKAIKESPSVNGVQDFLWAIALHPEFQLIY